MDEDIRASWAFEPANGLICTDEDVRAIGPTGMRKSTDEDVRIIGHSRQLDEHVRANGPTGRGLPRQRARST